MTKNTQKKAVKLLYDIYTLNIGINQRIEEIFREMQNEKEEDMPQDKVEPSEDTPAENKDSKSFSEKFKEFFEMFNGSKQIEKKLEPQPEQPEGIKEISTERMFEEINKGYAKSHPGTILGYDLATNGLSFNAEYMEGGVFGESTDELPADKPTPNSVWCGVCRKHHEKDSDGRIKHEPF